MIEHQNKSLSDEQKDNIWRVLKDANDRLNQRHLIIPNLQVIGISDSQYYSFKEYLKKHYIVVWDKQKLEETPDGLNMITRPFDIMINWHSLSMLGGLSAEMKEASKR